MVHNPVVKPNDAEKVTPTVNEGKSTRKPRIGVAQDEFAVPDSFFEPLPDEIFDAFRGENPK